MLELHIPPAKSSQGEKIRQSAISEAMTKANDAIADSDKSLPYVLMFEQRSKRSINQNDTSWMWYGQIAKQSSKSVSEVRAFCKLHFGVGILRAGNAKFRADYDRVVKPLDYKFKLKVMVEPIEMPVTSLMTKGQKCDYLNEMQRHYAENENIILEIKHG